MPFHLENVNLGGAGQLQSAMQIGEDIRKWREQREQTEKELGFADTVMKAAHTDKRISDEEYTDYLKMPANRKHSAAIGQMANVDADFKRQQLADNILAREQIARERSRPWSPDPTTLQRLESMGIVAAPTSGRSFQYFDTTKRKAADEDNWKKLNADTKAITGATLGEWNQSQNHRIEGGQFVADLPAQAPLPGMDAATAAVYSKPRKLKAPVHEYQTLLQRYNALSGTAAGGATPAAAAPKAPLRANAGPDQEAYDWAMSHPQDPLAPDVLKRSRKRLGLDGGLSDAGPVEPDNIQ